MVGEIRFIMIDTELCKQYIKEIYPEQYSIVSDIKEISPNCIIYKYTYGYEFNAIGIIYTTELEKWLADKRDVNIKSILDD